MGKKGYRELNRDKIIARLNKDVEFEPKLGFELEHILLHKGTGASASYSERGGVRDVLERLAVHYDSRLVEDGVLVGLKGPDETISVMSGGQLEISMAPFESVSEAEALYLRFRNRIDPILEEFGLETPMLGYSPVTKAEDIELVPTSFDECLDKYFADNAREGVCMMRGAAALRVAIDYRDEQDALRKLSIAEKIAPILSLICDNSPVFEGEERGQNMVRMSVLSSMNRHRSGLISGSLEAGFSFSDYADVVLSGEGCVCFKAATADGGHDLPDGSFDEMCRMREMTDAEIDRALSMVWSDVRLKNFVEIRCTDAMPIEYCLAYVVLVRALFYSERNLDALGSLLANVGEADVQQARHELMERGYGAEIYGRPIDFWVDMLIVLATGSLEPGEAPYLEPISSMVKYRFTLAEIWPRLMEKRRGMPAGDPDAPIIGVVPRYDFEWTGLAIGDGYLSGLLETGAVPIVLPLTSDPAHIARLVEWCDGFLVPGGQDVDPSRYGQRKEARTGRSATSRDVMEQVLIQKAIAAGKPVLGICRGMQSLNVALGGSLCQDVLNALPDKGLVHVQKRPFDMPAHMVEIVEGSQLEQIVGAPHLGVNTIHHQCVDVLGEGLVVAAISPADGIVEAVEMPSKRFVIGVQWHPEHMWRRRPHSKRLFRALVEACKENV